MQRTFCLAALLCLLQVASQISGQSIDEESKKFFDEYLLEETSDVRRREIVVLMRTRPANGYRKFVIASLKSEAEFGRAIEFVTAIRYKGIFKDKDIKKLYDGPNAEAMLRYFVKSRDPDCISFVVSRFMEASGISEEFKRVCTALKLDAIPLKAMELIKTKLGDKLKGAAAKEIICWQLGLDEETELVRRWQGLKEGYMLESRTSPVLGEPLLDTGVWTISNACQVGENYRIGFGGKLACTAFPVELGERGAVIRARVAILAGRDSAVRLEFGGGKPIGAKTTAFDWEAEIEDPTQARRLPLTARQWMEFRWHIEYRKEKKLWRVSFFIDTTGMIEGVEFAHPPVSLSFEAGGRQQLLVGSVDYDIGK